MKSLVSPAASLLRRETRLTTVVLPGFNRPILCERPNSRTTIRRSTLPTHRKHSSQPHIAVEAQRKHFEGGGEPLVVPQKRSLPITCSGCGALTQTTSPDLAGYYNLERRAVRKFLGWDEAAKPNGAKKDEEIVFNKVIAEATPELLRQLGLDGTPKGSAEQEVEEPAVPICDRCHKIVHQHAGESIIHPSIASIEETIQQSPHRKHHIYHVIDAADFPMSIVPGILEKLSLARIRTQNRRSKSHRYVGGKLADISFIITRSDLLAPKKEQVDLMMPALREILREALGTDKKARLGNLRCVSAKRGWWTKNVKEDIWERGGACWMVGKVNVGKSNLFEAVFPKGRNEDVNFDRVRNQARNQKPPSVTETESGPTPFSEEVEASRTELDNHEQVQGQQKGELDQGKVEDALDSTQLDESSYLLPPAQPLTDYPTMPIISELPGTTAAPIRIPFGNGKGELIDLPGLERSKLAEFVKPEFQTELVMKKRVVPERIVIKPGQSLLLGGMIRITPKTPDQIFMAHCFVPEALKPHLTATAKADQFQTGQATPQGVKIITLEDKMHTVRSAGTYKISWDVTRQQAGPLTRKDAAGLKPSRLPFVVYASDILIEGCGWIEVVAQLRKKKAATDSLSSMVPVEVDLTPEPPEIEIFTPMGKFIGQRQPLNCWLVGGPKKSSKKRPRRSMAVLKARMKGNQKAEQNKARAKL